MSVIVVNKDNFEAEVLSSDKPCLVDFWASWCNPCRMLSPIVDEIANEQAQNIKVCKVNIDEESELALKFSVMTIPTLLLFKNGKVEKTSIGYKPKSEIEDFIK
ncbi:MAG: thioredoxin [Oscillospiraceae bacterium]